MAKLYPPYIEGTIPAFYKNDTDGTAKLVVPFSMNRAVSKSSVTGFYARVKTVQSNQLMFALEAKTTASFDLDANNEVIFTLSKNQASKLNIGQYYKVQIAYDNNGTEGYYSTVGVAKFTTKPTVMIDSLVSNSINMHAYSYTGRYIQATFIYKKITILNEDLYSPNTYYEINNDGNGYVLCEDEIFHPEKTYFMKLAVNDVNDTGYRDSSEKEYSYRFVIYDNRNQIRYDSGTLLHNSSEDTVPYESSDSYIFPSDLEENTSFYLQYIVTTNNGLVEASPKYRIMQKKSITPEIQAELIAEMNRDNGYVDIRLAGIKDEDGDETSATGSFLITRACADDGYKVWNEVLRFVLHGQHPSRWLWRDFTVEQGKLYKYSLQQYNDAKLYSSRILSNEIEADFEDAFLYDGTRQLKIKYNPKISSFKTNYLESRTNTIGSKYPFIFRNGNVAYREFPLSGLISYQSDEENLFMSDNELGLVNDFSKMKRSGTLIPGVTGDENSEYWQNISYAEAQANQEFFEALNTGVQLQRYRQQDEDRKKMEMGRGRTTSLESYNIAAERRFKLSVLDWLNNGEPKLFRSPTEGNYIVRLMNASLSPEEKTGRMLHSFTATAYEVADFDYTTLNNFNIISVSEPNNVQLRWASVPLSTFEPKYEDSRYQMGTDGSDIWYARGELLNHASARTVRFTDMLPGSLVYFTQEGDVSETSIVIGATGTYMLETGLDITSIRVPDDARYQGMITFSFYNSAQNVFNEIENIEILDTPAKQYIGKTTFDITTYTTDDEAEKIAAAADVFSVKVEPLEDAPRYNKVSYKTNNIVRSIENVRDSLINFLYLDFALRDIGTCFERNGEFYRDAACSNAINTIPSFTSMIDDNFAWNQVLTAEYDENGVFVRYKLIDPEHTYPVSGTAFDSMLKNGYFADPFMLYRYEKNGFTLYHDPTRPTVILVDPKDEEEYRKLFKTTNYEVYGTTITIDGHTLDLSQTGGYSIPHTYSFENVQIDNGVVLNCGYQVQRIHYSLEGGDMITGDPEVHAALKEVLDRDNILSQEFKRNMCLYEDLADDSSDVAYNLLAAAALKGYNDKMNSFLDKLGIAKAEWEANENL